MATARLGLTDVWTATMASSSSNKQQQQCTRTGRTGRNGSFSSGYSSRSHSRASSRSSRRSFATSLMGDFPEEGEYIEKSSVWDIREETSDDSRLFADFVNPMAAGVLDDQYLFQSLDSILSGEAPRGAGVRSASSSVTSSPNPSLN